MKIWYDACTGKHVRYAAAIAEKLEALGHRVVLTTREHPDTIRLTQSLKKNFICVGKYRPASLKNRLKESLRRELQFCRMFEDSPPDCALSHGSIDLCRVAFGLGVPTISTADSPHATKANKLALPLVDYIITSKAIPTELYEKYCSRILQFEGVDEVAWIKNFKPEKTEFDPPFIVVRQMETRATYLQGRNDVTGEIAQKLRKIGPVIFLPRYDKRERKNLIIPKKFVDSASLAAQAALVVSIGGTIAREAALQGTPSIVIPTINQSHVNTYLSAKGFPLYTMEKSEIEKYATRYFNEKQDTKKLLARLENPVHLIKNTVEKAVN